MPIYLYVMLFSISYPLAQSFEWRLKYYTKWKALFPAILIVSGGFLVWDQYYTYLGVWGFNPNYLLGVFIGHLPIEEIIFFIVVPYASVFIYECVLYFLPKVALWKSAPTLAMLCGAILLGIAAFYFENLYTGVTFLLSGGVLIFHGIKKFDYLPSFIIAYFIHLIPFLIVNGILTGSFLEEPIVWYNESEMIGIRIGTIPVEDSIYGLLLFMLTVTFYEYFKKKLVLKHITK